MCLKVNRLAICFKKGKPYFLLAGISAGAFDRQWLDPCAVATCDKGQNKINDELKRYK